MPIAEPVRISVATTVVDACIPQMLNDRRETSVSVNEIRKLVDHDDGVFRYEVAKQYLPVVFARPNGWVLRRCCFDEPSTLCRGCPLDSLIVHCVLAIPNHLTDEFAFTDLPAAVDHCEFGSPAIDKRS